MTLPLPVILKFRSSVTWRHFSHQAGEPLPGVSPVAIQQGRHARVTFFAMIKGRKPQRFPLLGQGKPGDNWAEQGGRDLKFIHLSGLPAWVAWLFVHIIFLVGFRNACSSFFNGLGPILPSIKARG